MRLTSASGGSTAIMASCVSMWRHLSASHRRHAAVYNATPSSSCLFSLRSACIHGNCIQWHLLPSKLLGGTVLFPVSLQQREKHPLFISLLIVTNVHICNSWLSSASLTCLYLRFLKENLRKTLSQKRLIFAIQNEDFASHSDSTRSLQRIHWRASDVTLNFSKLFLFPTNYLCIRI